MANRDDEHPELPIDPDAEQSRTRRDSRPHHRQPHLQVYVAVGGLFGTAVRYEVAVHFPARTSQFPTDTLIVNLVGAFILGLLLEGLVRLGDDVGWRRRARLLVGAGFCGALTTYSTLATETDLLIRGNDPNLAAIYMTVSVLGGLTTTACGIAIATAAHQQRQRRSGYPS